VAADRDRVRVWCDGRLVADHVRCWHGTRRSATPSTWPPRPSRATSRRCWGVTRHPSDADEVQLRQLTDYDAAFGLDDSQGWPDGGHHRHDGAGPSRRARLPHRALKTPTLRQSVAQLAERARAESWPHEEFLPACNAGSPPARLTAARPHPAGSVPSPQVAGGFRLRPRSVAQRRDHRSPGHPQLHAGQEERGLRRPTRAGKPTWPSAWGSAPARPAAGVLFATATKWVARLADAHTTGRLQPALVRLAGLRCRGTSLLIPPGLP
jgi:hypothetical protein